VGSGVVGTRCAERRRAALSVFEASRTAAGLSWKAPDSSDVASSPRRERCTTHEARGAIQACCSPISESAEAPAACGKPDACCDLGAGAGC